MSYGVQECDIMQDGKPRPESGNVFVAIHGGKARPGTGNDNNLSELYDFMVTLTMRVTIPLDRVGDQLIARSMPLTINSVPAAQRQGFDAKVEQLRAFLHMNWKLVVLQNQTPPSANDNLAAWASVATVYGFAEPMRYRGAEVPSLQGGEWMGAEPDTTRYRGAEVAATTSVFAIKSALKFEGAKRFQPISASQGSFV